ncbi:pyridoxamine 5'-phosphate oxidase family protein [Paenibacillus timonensis]|uniref:Pyridoxamine 5'-phosphate oxidase family protein n=1 Tax=Paenibacillus timonensis TaxID=225915 RepID=A0ABW3SD62_9BACL|nr:MULTISPECIES: pyridoxamine 5'-phosphate oxidase family protein [Paenibacillus]MCH1641396.1 pyridoxamine 5'-phosphate oxidase family protein [Paenibacillus timonensis]MDU2241511.1 pyridoxamine 5'-phosphate oxidase family protein [Paenibacillus sp.]
MTNDQAAHREAVETVRKLIKGIEIAMLTTVTQEGLVSRPMKTQEVEFDGDLWFLTKEETDKYTQLKQHPNVNVSYVGDSYVSVRGTAEVVNDRGKIEQFWNPAYAKFLHTTSDDPNLILIKVKAEAAEYWETGNLVKMIKRMFSQLTGKETEAELNKTVKL